MSDFIQLPNITLQIQIAASWWRPKFGEPGELIVGLSPELVRYTAREVSEFHYQLVYATCHNVNIDEMLMNWLSGGWSSRSGYFLHVEVPRSEVFGKLDLTKLVEGAL